MRGIRSPQLRPSRERPRCRTAKMKMTAEVTAINDGTDTVAGCLGGRYYHLRDPLLALSRLRQAMKPGNTSVSVIGVIHMSQADYEALTAANLHFV